MPGGLADIPAASASGGRWENARPEIDASLFDAVLLDLDGVLTDTASLHAAAWKETFDAFLRGHASERGLPFRAFDADEEYRRFVDGKPRFEGVADFLAARGIALPAGGEDDPPGSATIHAIGAAKNARFLQRLRANGVKLEPGAESFLRKARSLGLRIAVVTASRNGREVVERAGLAREVDTLVDGTLAAETRLAGKPRPDSYLEAARRLGVEPERAVVIEDALAGVEAGSAGEFGLVVGIGDAGSAAALRDAGADVVVADLGRLRLCRKTPARVPPCALANLARIRERLSGRRPAVFLDYDGTLTPIVERPELAVLAPGMRTCLGRLAGRAPVTIVSGRGRADLESLVGLDGLIYAGAHGFDISGPGGSAIRHELGRDYEARLAEAAARISRRLRDVKGVLVEDKKQAVAIHYRCVAPDEVDRVERVVGEVVSAADGLRRTGGKMVFELRPDIDWDKGRAVLWLLDRLGLGGAEVLPIYIGDDLTDFDAFRAVAGRGLSLFVAEAPAKAPADYRLADPGEVRGFLEWLADRIGEDAR